MARTQNAACRAEIIRLREQGWSLRLIAQHLGVSATTVRYHAQNTAITRNLVKRPHPRATQLCSRLKPSPELAYFWGIFAGDGSLWQGQKVCKLSISCDARYPELIETYTALLSSLTGKAAKVASRISYVEVYLYGKHLPYLLDLPSGNKATNGFTVPEWIFENTIYVRLLLKGLIETDGGIYHEFRNGGWCSRCIFIAHHEAVMQAFLRGTLHLGYTFRQCRHQARLTRTLQVKQLVMELDLDKQRTYNY